MSAAGARSTQTRQETSSAMTETPISRRESLLLTAWFLVLLVVPVAVQCTLHPAEQTQLFARLLGMLPTFPPGQQFINWADDLARDSATAAFVRRYYQLALTASLDEGSAKVVVGRGGWLFLREDLNLAYGTAVLNERLDPTKRKPDADDPDSVAVIAAYNELLRDRGIHLVLLPVPTGPVLYPEKIWPGYPADAGPAWAPDYAFWKDRVRQAGVDVLDLTDDLWRAKSDPISPWLRNNTHWSPHGVEVAAENVVAHIRPLLETVTPRKYTPRQLSFDAPSDLTPMLDLPRDDFYPRVPCTVTQVWQGDSLAAGNNDSPVLLLGDSYSYIYSGEDPEDTRGADLGRQIMLRLQSDIQVIAYKGDDPSKLRWRLGYHGACLDAKKIVIWEFATRYLHDPVVWKFIPIPPVGGAKISEP